MKYKHYRNPYTNDNRIYSFLDIYTMPLYEVLSRKQELLSQYRVLGVPTEKELRGSDNVVYVESYTRDDGTEVKAHYRSKPNSGGGVNNKASSPNGGASEIDDEKNSKELKENLSDVKTENILNKNSKELQEQQLENTSEQQEQEKDKRLYPDEIAGVKRGEPMTFEDVVKKGVNPSYDKTVGTDIDDGNCNSCVAAYVYCRRGYNVNAASTLDNEKAEELSHNGFDLWIEPYSGDLAEWTEIDNSKQNTFEQLSKIINAGEIYELAQYPQLKAGDLSTVDGHVIIIEKDNDGQLKIYDPQKREVYEDSKKSKMYIDSWIDAREMAKDIKPKIIRVDNKQINPYYEGVLVH